LNTCSIVKINTPKQLFLPSPQALIILNSQDSTPKKATTTTNTTKNKTKKKKKEKKRKEKKTEYIS
jgi:hypothetical protein